MTSRRLIDRALAADSTTRPPAAVVELALAWARGEVRLVGVKRVLKRFADGSTIYVPLARGLREAIRSGRLRERTKRRTR